MKPTLHLGDCREVLRSYPDNFFDSSVDDAPYGLNAQIDAEAMLKAWMAGEVYEPKGSGFMGRDWDKCVPGPDTWREVLRVLKPGAHLLVFGGSATVGLTEIALRLAGFEIRDQMQYLHGEGMPKGSTIDKTIDKKLGAERKVVGTRTLTGNAAQTTKEKGGTYGANTDARGVPAKVVPITEPATEEAKEWEGWAPALKPAHEPIIVARKPLEKGLTLTQNVLKWGTGALNIDACRIEAGEVDDYGRSPARADGTISAAGRGFGFAERAAHEPVASPLGRWPANVIASGIAADLIDQQSGERPGMSGGGKHRADYEGGMFGAIDGNPAHARGDSGGASRFFFHPQESDLEWLERNGVNVAELNSEHSSRAIAAALGLAVTGHGPAARPSSECRALITSATPTELRRLVESAIGAIQSIEFGSLREWQHESVTLSRNGVSVAVRLMPTGTMTITASHWKSDGSAAPVTFSITLPSAEAGEAASRFMYHPKPGRSEKDAGLEGRNSHVTVKGIDLMRHLVRLVTPPGGKCLDSHMGSGTTGIACKLEGFEFHGSEWEELSFRVAGARIDWWSLDRLNALGEVVLPKPRQTVSQLALFQEATLV